MIGEGLNHEYKGLKYELQSSEWMEKFSTSLLHIFKSEEMTFFALKIPKLFLTLIKEVS